LDRLQELQAWLASVLPDPALRIEPASADASFRRYFRAHVDKDSWIVMDAPPQHEDCRPFIKVAELMAEAGLNVPRVIARDLDRGFLLLTDLGTTTYLQSLQQDRSLLDDLMPQAIRALVKWQTTSRENVLPPYSEALLRRELDLFPEWYLQRHCGLSLTDSCLDGMETTFSTLTATILSQARVYVHRDFMPRNLMRSNPEPGVLDFQDAVLGPISYDIASLMRDAFISWQENEVIDMTVRYWEEARRASLPVPGDFSEFYRDVEWMGMQRHLKVLGIFARLKHRDGKTGYVEDTPRFLGYLRATASRYGALSGLLPLLDRIEERTVTGGLTF
jgi:hypothetical protein